MVQKSCSHYNRAWGGIIALIAMLGCFVAFMVRGYIADYHIKPPDSKCTISELENKIGPPQHLAIIKNNNTQYLVWIGYVPSLTIRSGPPCYIFDERGKLVDWCSESGEGWPLQNLVDNAFDTSPISLDEAIEWVKD